MLQAEFKTEQEDFWSGNFGTNYSSRNDSAGLLASNLNFFSTALKFANPVDSCIEFGANIGMNLRALKLLFPNINQYAVEINPDAANSLKNFLNGENIYQESILNFNIRKTHDLALAKGLLIHINPALLVEAYEKIYLSSHRYILLCEYYNPSPVMIPYRGFENRLFKRDFCGDMLDIYSDLTLIDYGFVYKRDPTFPQDDITWFLLKKEG